MSPKNLPTAAPKILRTPAPKILRTVPALRRHLDALRRQGLNIGLVPTMGALHEGHLSLVRQMARQCDHVVVSIFVNPLQFGPQEDLAKYPRRLKQDAALVATAGAGTIFAPTIEGFYAPNHQTIVMNEAVEGLYCGAFRPGHFRGVLTVVAKLFHAVSPDEAIFGAKDYQQLWLLQRMVRDLDWPLKIRVGKTVREKDGLAMSSRNEFLSPEERAQAAAVPRALQAARALHAQGEASVARLTAAARRILTQAGGEVQYVEIASRATLLPLKRVDEPAVILTACKFGTTRLIDNLEL